MAYSKAMQTVLDKNGLKKENVLYLPIAMMHLNRIKSGEKKVEFRDLTDFYLRKVADFSADGAYKGDKPLKAVLFQGGYSSNAPRLLMEMKYYLERDPKNFPVCGDKVVLKEAVKEGFVNEDEYLAIVLGEALHTENF